MRAKKTSRFWGGFPSLDTLGISLIFILRFFDLKALCSKALTYFLM